MNLLSPIDGAVSLSHVGVIRARGADAAKFLHGQLTNDVLSLGPSQVRLAGFCSAKGRLQASFLIWKETDADVLLMCSAGVLQPTLKRLSMFVLRAQCKLSDATREVAVWGVAGESAENLMANGQVWEKRDAGGACFMRLPDAAGRLRVVCAGAQAQNLVVAAALPSIALDDWLWLEVQSGLPTIEAATAEQFVPQMVNFELIGGVDFKKGCYPGQEVVARSQYRGTTKRRTFLFDSDAVAIAGQEIFHSDDPTQPAGMVANASARSASSGSSLLGEVKLAAMKDGSLHLGSAQGALLRRAAMPYDVPLESE